MNSDNSDASHLSMQDFEKYMIHNTLEQEVCKQDDSQPVKSTRRPARRGRWAHRLTEEERAIEEENEEEQFKQFLQRVKQSRLNIDLKSLIQCYQGEKNLRNILSDKFDDIEQEFLSTNKFNFELLQELGYAQPKSMSTLPQFNLRQLYQDSQLIQRVYGRAYLINLIYNQFSEPKRFVSVLQSKINFEELNKHTSAFGDQEVFDTLYRILHNMCTKYHKSIEDVADIFVKVSGDLEAMKNYLEGKRVIEWSVIEDLALSKDQSSNDYSILVKTKGIKELEKRKAFLFEGAENNQL